MTVINFDEACPERKPKTVIIRGTTYEASDPSMGALIDAIEASQTETDDMAAMAAVRAFMVEVFGEDAEGEILHTLGTIEYQRLITMLMEAFAEEGKAAGPSRASRRAGARSKPTSKATTTSTSAKRASAQNGSVAATSHA